MKEFWESEVTWASWEKLLALRRSGLEFVLIGGWSAFLWTGTHKSRDIDIIVDYEGLKALQEQYRLDKNERLRKYEIKMQGFDIDIYLPYYSQLALPVEELLSKFAAQAQGIKTVKPEALLVLKQGAEIDRRGTPKGRKDAIDIATLLLKAPLDLREYAGIARQHGKQQYVRELLNVLKSIGNDELQFLPVSSLPEYAKWKRAKTEELKKLL